MAKHADDDFAAYRRRVLANANNLDPGASAIFPPLSQEEEILRLKERVTILETFHTVQGRIFEDRIAALEVKDAP